MTNPIAGFGTTIKYAAGTLVGKLVSIGGVKLKGETIDITNHDSADGFKEFIGGLKDAGEFPMEGNFVQSDAGQLALMASFNSGALESFVVTFPDTSTWAFSAIVTGIEVGKADLKDQLNFSATLKISGKPVFAGVTVLRTVTFTVTASAVAVPGAAVVFNNETKLTDASGVAAFYNVADATYYYAVGKALYTPVAKAIVVNGAEAEAVTLVLA